MKVHLNLIAGNLETSVQFYRALLGAEPAKRYADYALFLTADPALELALDSGEAGSPNDGTHYGIAVDEPGGVDTAIERLRGAGYPVDVEAGETCCYATQDKVWATDPDGRRWETYYVLAESEERDGDGRTCC